MQLTVKGKQIDVGDALRQHVTDHLTETAGKYFHDPIEATVVFSREAGHLFRADISIHVGKGILLQSHHEADDPYPAFDLANQRIAKRMRRYKNRLVDHKKRMADEAQWQAAYYTLRADEAEDETSSEASEPAVIAELTTPLQQMTVSEAVMRMELADLPALLFKNSGHGGLNMVYRRKDGHIGWVDPTGNEKTKKTGK